MKRSTRNLIFAAVIMTLILWLLCMLQGCANKEIPSSTLSGDVIKESKTMADPQIACLQESIKKQTIFKHTFKYDDSYPPTLYVYITGEWNSLDDEARDSTLTAIGKMWQSCNPANNAVLTVMAYDSNNIPLLAVYVTRGD